MLKNINVKYKMNTQVVNIKFLQELNQSRERDFIFFLINESPKY